ncbi:MULTISPECIES: nuclear transport factor 2 family protein [Sphingobium]|uniref:nuclear transport factor 2 family protein n=1 Tax=Sphingobium sp. MI1205 TaxID=407020 RepID=UPI0007704B58|nr:nuclear transport factor 2 family protein [Sphingobium sp. MI1205]AMK19985.1 gamma-hexachlorocyclohexane dehydrochlorinase [Sphingobium sp. MI1205]
MKDYSVAKFQTELADREAIRHCLLRYCRGVDRLDRSLLDTVYWPGAIDDHINFVGSGEEFVDHVLVALQPMHQTQHLLGNMLIELDEADAAADSETYFQAFHAIPREDGTVWDLLVGGRYVDRFEKRDDQWRIAARTVIIDWFREYPDSGDFAARPIGLEIKPGTRAPDDRSYDLVFKSGF